MVNFSKIWIGELRKVTRALTEENNVAKIMTTPGLTNLDYSVAKRIADANDYLSVRGVLDELFDTGVINQVPGKQSGLTNAVLRQSALTHASSIAVAPRAGRANRKQNVLRVHAPIT